MPTALHIADPNYVQKQYRNAGNLNARLRLHQEFSTNKYGWFRWLFDQINLPKQGRVLELGCGAGSLWQGNLDRLPTQLEFTLSDLSTGMLEQAQANLKDSPIPFEFKIIDAQSIPFEDQHFEVVIANHMLYHVPDMGKALREIRRVLKPGGYFYASTIGKGHMKELNDLISRYDANLATWGNLPPESFILENGAEILHPYFSSVKMDQYVDSLVVTDADMLLAYIFSGRAEYTSEQKDKMKILVDQAMQENGGKYFIIKASGVFQAVKE